VKPWTLIYTRQADKDSVKLASSAGLKKKAQQLLQIIAENPYANPPAYEKLSGECKNTYSRRINIQYRLVYQVIEETRIIKVLRIWTHYE